MIVQSPGQRYPNEAIPSGLGKPSMGSRPTSPNPMRPRQKPRPNDLPTTRPPVYEKPIKQPPLDSNRRPRGGMVNPLAPTSTPINTQIFSKSTPGMGGRGMDIPTPRKSGVPTMQAEVVTPQQGFENQGGFNSSTGVENNTGYAGYDQRYDDPSFYMTPEFIAAERERDPAQINAHLEDRRNYFQGGVEGFTPTAQFKTLDSWDQWRKGRGAFLG